MSFNNGNIAIIGAGQAGLQIAIGLIKKGFYVSLYSNNTPEQILNGRIKSSQALFHSALQIERTLQLNFWDSICPQNKSVSFFLLDTNANKLILNWKGITKDPYQSVDQRLKFSRWLHEFKILGGNLHIQEVTINDLEQIATQNELTIIATGKSEINTIFPINKRLSKFCEPQRSLLCLYVTGMQPVSDLPGVRINVIPQVGEYISMPGLTKSGNCEMILFEGIKYGPFDCWDDMDTQEQILRQVIFLLRKFLPWEFDRCKNIKVTDNNAILKGSYTPVIRYPIAQLASGKLVLGLGDTIILNDPIGGQGANIACKTSYLYMQRIIKSNKSFFDKEWMQQTFQLSWQRYGKAATNWTNILLDPMNSDIRKLMTIASQSSTIANIVANGFDNPLVLLNFIKKKYQMTQESSNYSLECLITKNIEYTERYKENKLMKLIISEQITDKRIRQRLLDSIQVFSNYFQKAVLLRSVLCTDVKYNTVVNKHLVEEFQHNISLDNDRNNRPIIWDPTLDSGACWFVWNMLTKDNEEKTVLMHFVLESSAALFFQKAHKVMMQYNETNYFNIHVDLDEQHQNLGLHLLQNLTIDQYSKLLIVQQQGWDVLNTICNRIAELTVL